MVSGLNQQQNRNLQYGAQNIAAPNMRQVQYNNNQGQNFGALTAKPDTFENTTDPNFGAIDRQMLEQGAQEITKTVEENPFTMMLKNMFGIDINNPKKTLTSLALTLVTVIGLAKLGNSKLSTDKLPDLGIKVSEALKNNKAYMNITTKMKGAKESLVKFLRKSKTLDDVFETFANRKAKAVNPMAKGTGTGLKRIFSLTPPDTAGTVLDKMTKAEDAAELARLKGLVESGRKAEEQLGKLHSKGKKISADKLNDLTKKISDAAAAKAPLEALQDKVDAPKLESLKKIVGESKAKEMLNALGGDSMDVSNKLLNLVGENFGVMKDGVVTDEKGLQTILRQLKSGKITGLDGKLNIDVSEFTNITMNNNKGLLKLQGDWWPTNIVNNIGKKIRGDKWKDICRGNLGDALIKHSVISGQATSTKIGSFVQQSLLFPTEAISNFVNDKSGLGFFLCGMIMNLYNNVQDAPKEKKVATMADDFMGTIGSLAITMPLACATMYGAATLKNVKGNSIISKYLLKPIGKFFGMGLDRYAKDGTFISSAATKSWKNFIPRWAGGAMRLGLVMFGLSTLFSKPVRNITHKIFGKPYDPDEAAAQQTQEGQKARLEAAMTKLQAHPEVVAALENDPEALKAIQQNPMLLVELLEALPDTPQGQGAGSMTQGVQGNKFANSNVPPSSLLNNQINSAKAAQPLNNANAGVQQQAPLQNNVQGQAQNQNLQTQAANQQTQAAAAPQTQEKKTNEPVRTYIPSSKPFNYVEGDTNTIKPEEITNANVQAMLSKADKAEQEAMRILG